MKCAFYRNDCPEVFPVRQDGDCHRRYDPSRRLRQAQIRKLEGTDFWATRVLIFENEEADDTFRPGPDFSSFVFTLANSLTTFCPRNHLNALPRDQNGHICFCKNRWTGTQERGSAERCQKRLRLIHSVVYRS